MTALNFGIIGSGMIASVIANASQQTDTVNLAGITSRNPDNARNMLTENGIEAPVFESVEALIQSADIDAIYVATPTAVREDLCIAAAKAGKHVMGEKPFASAESIVRIAAACRENGVAFMDATHFVHHPRTAALKAEAAGRMGEVQAVRAAFFFPLMENGQAPENVRFDPAQEPTGALGDMAWYTIRAGVEHLKPTLDEVAEAKVISHLQRDPATGAIIRGAGTVILPNGKTCNWDVGYNCGACIMDLDILGTSGSARMDDFVLDWHSGFAFNNPEHKTGYAFRQGGENPHQPEFVATPTATSQHVLMLEQFAQLAEKGSEAEKQAYVDAALKTQELLDLIAEQA